MPAMKTTTRTVLGKRKTRPPPSKAEAAEEESPISAEEAQAIFRRHFEAKFKPLSPTQTPAKPDASTAEDLRSDSDEDDDDNDDDDASEASWSGVSGAEEDSEEEEEIEVITHTSTTHTLSTSDLNGLSKREARAYLSSRVPGSLLTSTSTSTSNTTQTQKRKSASAENGEEDAPTLLKNDLALQRLLAESHLFSNANNKNDTSTTTTTSSSNSSNKASTKTTTTEHAGRNRHLATDLRMGALGSKRSIFAQQRMPMSIRKGIAGAAADREIRRRREARESGVVLERKSGTGGTAAWSRGFGTGGRDRGRDRRKGSGGGGGGGGGKAVVDAPAVGRLRNGMLTLSKRDVSEIQGSGGGGLGGGRGGRGGKRRRR